MMYRWILALHIVADISWMAGVLYLFRLFVNHRDAGFTEDGIHRLLVGMESRLYRVITLPAMLVATSSGIAMSWLNSQLWSASWFMVKVAGATALIAATVWCGQLLPRFSARDASLPSGRFFRYANEVPTLLMIIIVVMVTVRPF
jgi:protoporphyrinogen IX oxidase